MNRFQKYVINELESGTIEVLIKPILQKISGLLWISTFNSKGNPYNRRQLGTYIIRELIQAKKQGAWPRQLHRWEPSTLFRFANPQQHKPQSI